MLEKFKEEKARILEGPGMEAEKDLALREITVENMKIEDLYLDFTLPGYPDVDLVENGKNTMLSIFNVEQYIMAIIEMTVGSGIKAQVDSFRRGFNRVFPVKDLRCFSIQELALLMGGEQKEDWSLKGIVVQLISSSSRECFCGSWLYKGFTINFKFLPYAFRIQGQ